MVGTNRQERIRRVGIQPRTQNPQHEFLRMMHAKASLELLRKFCNNLHCFRFLSSITWALGQRKKDEKDGN